MRREITFREGLKVSRLQKNRGQQNKGFEEKGGYSPEYNKKKQTNKKLKLRKDIVTPSSTFREGLIIKTRGRKGGKRGRKGGERGEGKVWGGRVKEDYGVHEETKED